jgi:adenosylcobinamide-GDP ribazoletransferase
VGALIGLAVGGAWWGAAHLWPPLVAAALAVTADVVITGMLHLDGLSDSADGLIAPMDRARRLAVMRDPSVGAFGAVALVVTLLLRFSAFAAASSSPWTVAAIWCASRTAMAVIAAAVPYARAGGLASAFLGGRPATTVAVCLAVGIVIAVPLAVLGLGWWGLLPLGCVALGAGSVAQLARRRIGGFTGDVLGAAGVVGETIGLLAMAAL